MKLNLNLFKNLNLALNLNLIMNLNLALNLNLNLALGLEPEPDPETELNWTEHDIVVDPEHETELYKVDSGGGGLKTAFNPYR